MSKLFFIIALAVAAPDRPDPTPKDPRASSGSVYGDWLYLGDRPDAKRNPSQPVYTFRILPGESVWIENGKPSTGNGFTAKLVLDLEKNPATIDFHPKRGGGVLRGILKVEGDLLTLCWTNSEGGQRPQMFQGAPHSIHYFQRVKN